MKYYIGFTNSFAEMQYILKVASSNR